MSVGTVAGTVAAAAVALSVIAAGAAVLVRAVWGAAQATRDNTRATRELTGQVGRLGEAIGDHERRITRNEHRLGDL